MYVRRWMAVGVLFVSWTMAALAQSAMGMRWVRMDASTAPAARSGAAMAYDPVSASIVLFGGMNHHGYLNDTWKFNGSVWQQVLTPAMLPARTAAGIAYDTAIGKLVMFGGYGRSGYLHDTWLWNGANSSWEKANPKSTPPPVTGPMLFTDPLSGHADLFGGFDGVFYRWGTWQWTGSDWLMLHPVDAPTARASAVVAWDRNRHIVLFGGLASCNPDNTWTWDGINWTRQWPDAQPSLRYNSAGAYDPAMQAAVIFGGGSGGVDLNDTWVWDGANWEQMLPA